MVQGLDPLSIIGLIVIVERQLYCFPIFRMESVQLRFEISVVVAQLHDSHNRAEMLPKFRVASI